LSAIFSPLPPCQPRFADGFLDSFSAFRHFTPAAAPLFAIAPALSPQPPPCHFRGYADAVTPLIADARLYAAIAYAADACYAAIFAIAVPPFFAAFFRLLPLLVTLSRFHTLFAIAAAATIFAAAADCCVLLKRLPLATRFSQTFQHASAALLLPALMPPLMPVSLR
jgi:hypothetical protein